MVEMRSKADFVLEEVGCPRVNRDPPTMTSWCSHGFAMDDRNAMKMKARHLEPLRELHALAVESHALTMRFQEKLDVLLADIAPGLGEEEA